ncbi:hypothetical protein FOA52_004261 [Chlamydomonas sp. UWO 241]|nr:hypothetical protein FOA52_004261 [Chlamydomonas sp. UWO 241]
MADAPAKMDFQVKDSGGEVSMSFDETNKLRISLGMKPLNNTAPQSGQLRESDVRAQEEQTKRKEEEKSAAEMRAKIAAHKSARQQSSFLAVKNLGDDNGDDDMASWVQRNRSVTAARAKAAEAAKSKGSAKPSTNDEDDDEDGAGGVGGRGGRSSSRDYGAADVAGLKLRHGLGEFGTGEEVVLTLADRNILDEKGVLDEDDEGDELENVRIAELRKRDKAREASAPKAKPLWEEDGKVRGMLDKYDALDDEVVRLGELEDATERRQLETRRRLAEASGKILDSANTDAKPNVIRSDYATADDAAKKDEKKKKRKDRKMRTTRVADADDDGGDTSDLMAALEAQASGDGAPSDLGSRGQRDGVRARAEVRPTGAL